MRSNLVKLVAAVGLAASLGLVWLNPGNVKRQTTPGPQESVARETPATPGEVPLPASPRVALVGSNQPSEESVGTPEQRQDAYVASRAAELMELAMNEDTASLTTILSELGNRDPRVRKAAVDAAVQFHSRDAIPALEEAVSQTDDARERVAILEAIEFLKLPTLTEALQAQKAAAGGTLAPR